MIDALAVLGTEVSAAGDFESFAWTRLDDLVAKIEAGGVIRVDREPVAQPWPGEHLAFQRAGNPIDGSA